MRAHLRQCGCRFSGPAPSEKIGLISATATAAEQQQPPVTGAVAAGSVGSLSFWWSDVERALMNATLQRGELAQFFSSKIFKKKSHCPARSGTRRSQQPSAVRAGVEWTLSRRVSARIDWRSGLVPTQRSRCTTTPLSHLRPETCREPRERSLRSTRRQSPLQLSM